MGLKSSNSGTKVLIWIGIAIIMMMPILVAANSPQLAWRDPIYSLAGFAGIFAMTLLFVQPLAVGGYLPNLNNRLGRKLHRWIGGILLVSVLLHVVGLWITSPPDVIDALLFASPTPFSIWGVVAMWAVFATAFLATFKRRLRPCIWQLAHFTLVVTIVTTSIFHAILIEGTMGIISKIILCVMVTVATAVVIRPFLFK